jgi:Phage integrase, N-terminal SAM-like domain
MNSRGNLQRKCVKAHPKTAGKCSSRCIRWYPRLELPRGPDGARRFESLGGYPTRAQADVALADALARRSHGFLLDPTKLTVDQYLDRWLAHIRTTRRARTVARYTALLRDYVRPSIGARPLKQLTPLEVQAIYDRLAVGGRRDGKPGGLAPSTSWPCTAACTAPWPRPSSGGWWLTMLPPMPPRRRSPAPRQWRLRPRRSRCCWPLPTTQPAAGLGPGRFWQRRPGPATASCAAWKPDPRTGPDWAAQDRVVAGQGRCGRDRIRTCVGNAGDLQVAPLAPRGSRPIPTWSRSSLVTCTNDLPTASAVTRRPCPYRPDPRDATSGGGKSEGNPGCHLTR